MALEGSNGSRGAMPGIGAGCVAFVRGEIEVVCSLAELYPAMGDAKAPRSAPRLEKRPEDFSTTLGVFSRPCLLMTLKSDGGCADEGFMFVYHKDPVPLSEACLLGLCASLNAPVVSTDELPSGPARAAIVTFAEEYGDLGMAIGLRALEDGSVAVFRYREPIVDAADVSRAMDDALGFAEGLGFLFDDDMITPDTCAGRADALDHWNRLMGEGEVFTTAGVVDPPTPLAAPGITLPGEGLDEPMEDLLAPPSGSEAAVGETTELLLDDLMLVAEESQDSGLLLDSAPVDAPPKAVASPGSVPARAVDGASESRPDPCVPLSKFRGGTAPDPVSSAAASTPLSEPRSAPRRAAGSRKPRPTPVPERPAGERAAEGEGGAAALGRIPIVQRRRTPETGRPGLLARLLSSF